MANVQLNIDELKGFLNHIINNNKFLQENNKMPVAIEVMGESGIGKTSTIIQCAKENNLNFVKLNLAQIEELGDLVGFPVRQFQMFKEIKTEINSNSINYTTAQKISAINNVNSIDTKKVGVWVDELAVTEYLKNGYKVTGKNRMSYCAPEWIADKKEGGILLLDDFNRADLRFIQATMELIDRQTYISWSLPKNWHIILTSNPDNGEYTVNSLDSAQKTRYITANLKFDVNIWARWAEKEEIDTRCINFLLLHPELVTTETNARSITTFFNSISSFESFENNLTMIQLIGEGSVGENFAAMFTLFINNKLDKLIHPKEILTSKDWDVTQKKLVDTIGKDNDYRADIAGVIATRIINYTYYHVENVGCDQKLIDRLINICIDEDLFTNDLRYFIIKSIVNYDKQRFQKLLMHPKLVQIAIK